MRRGRQHRQRVEQNRKDQGQHACCTIAHHLPRSHKDRCAKSLHETASVPSFIVNNASKKFRSWIRCETITMLFPALRAAFANSQKFRYVLQSNPEQGSSRSSTSGSFSSAITRFNFCREPP